MRFLTEILAKAGITSNYFQVDTAAATPAGAPGKIVWNDTDGTLEFQMKGGNVTQQIGQELPVLVKNADNTGLTNGKVVYQAGSDGSNVTVRYASASTEATSSKTFGVMTESATGGNKAFCTTFGYVRNIDTSLLTEGAMIWLSETAGEMTTTRPTQPAHGVVVGRCIRQHATVGVIFVSVQNGFELDEIHDVLITSKANNEILTYESATNLWKNKTIAAVLGYTPANDSGVVHIAGAETITGIKTFSSVINASTLSINGGTLVGNNIVSMRSNPTGGQFRIEKSDGSLSAYPFYIGVDGTALAYYYNASGALKVLLHTDNTSYFGNSLSVGYASYAATSYMLDVNGTARFTGALTGTSATFSGAINLTGTANSFQVASIFRNTNRVFFGGDTGGYFFQNSGNTSTILQIADSGYATFSYFLQATGKLFLQRASNGADTLIQFKNEAGVDRAYIKFGGTNEELSFYPGAGAAEAMQIKSTRQLQLNAYTSATSFSGTAAGYLAFDSSGNVITVAGVSSTDNTKLPLAGGTMTGALVAAAGDRGFEVNTSGGISLYSNEINAGALGGTGTIYMGWRRTTQVNVGVPMVLSSSISATSGSFSGPVTITGNGSYLGDWGYKTLELNDTSGYAGIFFRSGNNIWINRRDGVTNAMDWAYSTNASAQGTGTFTQKMRLASDEWWVSTYTGYKLQVTGGDQINALINGGATTLYLQYQGGVGAALNIAAGKYTLDNSGNGSASSSWRAPIFYDSNDTSYYGDFASTSSLWGLAIRGDNGASSNNNQLFFWGTGGTTTSAIGFKSNAGAFGNPTGFGDGYNTYLTMDTVGRGWVFRRGTGGTDFSAAYTAGWILNNGVWQSNGSMRAPIFYDSEDTGYYADFASTSRMNTIVYNDLKWAGDQSYGFLGRNVYADTINGRGSDPLELNYYDGGDVRIGTGVNGSKGLYAGALYDAGSRVAISRGEGRNYVEYSRYVYNNGAYSGSGWIEPSDLGVRYAASSNYSNSTGSLSGFDKTNPSFGAVYASNWFRAQGDCGLYSQDYGGHLRRSNGSSFGNWETFGYERNGWSGFCYVHNYLLNIMSNTSGDHGFYQENGNGWTLFYNRGNNCWGIGTDNTYSGDGFRCVKYGSSQYGWTTWSDRRAKENISSITGALDTVRNMRGVYFNYISDEAKNKRVGFIAQELELVLPEAVRYAEEIDEYNVEYAQIVSVLTEAIKEQDVKMTAQEAKIQRLEQLVEQLINQ